MLETRSADVGPIFKESKRNTPLIYRLREGRRPIDGSLALQIIEEAPFPGQRPVNAQHVALLAGTIKRGQFTDGTQIHLGLLNDKLYLLNGQHRLQAVIAAQRAVVFDVLITTVEHDEELGELYWRHDRQSRLRGVGDVLTGARIFETYGIKKAFGAGAYSAVGMIIAGFRKYDVVGDAYATRSDDARLEAARPYWPLVAKYQELIGSAPSFPKRVMCTAGIMAVALLTLRHMPEKAEEFWRSVAENDRLPKSDPRAVLLRDIVNRKPVGPFDWAKIAATAWNAFLGGRSINFLRLTEGPPVIAGTPFTETRRRNLMSGGKV